MQPTELCLCLVSIQISKTPSSLKTLHFSDLVASQRDGEIRNFMPGFSNSGFFCQERKKKSISNIGRKFEVCVCKHSAFESCALHSEALVVVFGDSYFGRKGKSIRLLVSKLPGWGLLTSSWIPYRIQQFPLPLSMADMDQDPLRMPKTGDIDHVFSYTCIPIIEFNF